MAQKQLQFKVGDRVAWTSQAAGSPREKFGIVAEVVPGDVGYEVRVQPHRGSGTQ